MGIGIAKATAETRQFMEDCPAVERWGEYQAEGDEWLLFKFDDEILEEDVKEVPDDVRVFGDARGRGPAFIDTDDSAFGYMQGYRGWAFEIDPDELDDELGEEDLRFAWIGGYLHGRLIREAIEALVGATPEEREAARHLLYDETYSNGAVTRDDAARVAAEGLAEYRANEEEKKVRKEKIQRAKQARRQASEARA